MESIRGTIFRLTEDLTAEYKKRYPAGTKVEFSYNMASTKQVIARGVLQKWDGDEAVITGAVVTRGGGKKMNLPAVLRIGASSIHGELKK